MVIRKNDIARNINKKTKIPIYIAEEVLDALPSAFVDFLREDGNRIGIKNLGTFNAKLLPEEDRRLTVGDRKGEIVHLPERIRVTFVPSRSFMNNINCK